MSPAQRASTVASSPFLFVGIKNSVVALHKKSGEIAWTTKLPRNGMVVTVLHEDAFVYASSGGEVACLNAATGEMVWHQPLKGMGTSYTTLALGSASPNAAAASSNAAAAAAAAAAAGAAAAAT